MRKATITAALVTFTVATGAWGQSQLNRSQERQVIEIITEVGGTCERVSRTQAVGQIDNGDTLMAIACTGGEQYVIRVDRRARMEWYSTCAALAEANNNLVRCFT